MIVELTSQQRALLLELVGRELQEIGPEIHHTRTREFRDTLKDRRRTAQSVWELLADVPVVPGAVDAHQ